MSYFPFFFSWKSAYLLLLWIIKGFTVQITDHSWAIAQWENRRKEKDHLFLKMFYIVVKDYSYRLQMCKMMKKNALFQTEIEIAEFRICRNYSFVALWIHLWCKCFERFVIFMKLSCIFTFFKFVIFFY